MNLEELADKAEKVIRGYPVDIPASQLNDWCVLKLQEELGELTQAYLKLTGRARLKGESPEILKKQLSIELADVLGFVLLIAKTNEVNLEQAINNKWFSLLERSAKES